MSDINPNDDYYNMSGKDIEKRIDEIDKLYSKIKGYNTQIGIHYMSKISGRIADDEMVKIRNSVGFRAGAIRTHLITLVRMHNRHNNIIKESEEDPAIYFDVLARRQFAIFDSIIFHSCSLLDYVGYLMRFICTSGDQQKKGWMDVIGSFRDTDTNLSDCIAAPIALHYNSQWIEKLFEYRANLIHYRAEVGGSHITADFEKMDYVLKTYTPSRLVRMIHPLSEKSNGEKVPLLYTSFWLSENAFSVVIDILKNIRQVVEYNIKKPKVTRPIKGLPGD